MSKRGRKLNLPSDGDYPVQLSIEYVLDLYRQETGRDLQNVSKFVTQWLAKEARSKGWSKVVFPVGRNNKKYQSAVLLPRKTRK